MIQACDALDIIRKKTIVNQGPSIRGSHRHGYVNAESPVSRKVDAGFGGGRLETQVKLCAGRLSHFVILCQDLATLQQAITTAHAWLAEIGLEIKASKTRLTHTLNEYEGKVGFDFLGFHIRQYHVGKYRTRTFRDRPGFKTLIQPSQKAVKRHTDKIREVIHQHRGAPQAALIAALNPIIRGWTLYYRTCVAKDVFSQLDTVIYYNLVRWAHRRHPYKSRTWRNQRYWKRQGTRTNFSDGTHTLINYAAMPITRHVKVKGNKCPFDGDWVYWATRLGKDPTRPLKTTRLLKQQQGRCEYCGLRLTTEDVMEIHHRNGNRKENCYTNLVLLHAHCHDRLHGEGINDNDLRTEELDDAKVSRPVLEGRRSIHYAIHLSQRYGSPMLHIPCVDS